jgi:hypothetical protein
MVEVIINEQLIAAGEPYFAVHVDKRRAAKADIVGELTVDLTGPVSLEIVKPRKLSGFELPALEFIQLAKAQAAEKGIDKILLVDPNGLLPLAKINLYAAKP